MAIYLAHAKSNEMGQTIGGKSGDQTGHEVEVTAWTEYSWTDVFRPLPSVIDPAEFAKRAVTICENNCIGYDHADRYSMFDYAKAIGWDFKNLGKPVCTDCSQMVSSIVNSFGISCNRWMWTGSMIGDMAKTKAFERLPYKGKEELKNGDVLLTLVKGHTATVIISEEPKPVPFSPWVGEAYGLDLIPVYSSPERKSLLNEWAYLGTGNLFDVIGENGDLWMIRIAAQYVGWIVKANCLRKTPEKDGEVTTALHLRANAGSGYKSICIMPKGAAVQICDQKRSAEDKPWDYVIYNGIYGFASDRYIKS